MRLLAILNFLLMVTSCHQANISAFKRYGSDAPKTEANNYQFKDIRWKSKELNLPVISDGVDSFELRIWKRTFITRQLLIDIRYTPNKWLASVTEFYEGANQVDSAIIQKIDIENPSRLVEYLTSDSILNLPSQEAIPNFVDNMADGQEFTIEMATRHIYKSLNYHCPEYFAENEPNNKRFVNLLLFLNGYYQFYTPLCKL